MKIGSIIDTITNSSNETFITASKPDSNVYEYVCLSELTWDMIESGNDFDFPRDLLVYLLEDHIIKRPLQNNPFPRTPPTDNTPWDQAQYSIWTEEELNEIWKDFVNSNKEDFEKIIGFCYVIGRDDNEYEDYYQWESDNDYLGEISILRSGRDKGFI